MEALSGGVPNQARDPDSPSDLELLSIVFLYDQRGGGVETSFKEDKQGLAFGHCNKRRLSAQKMLQGCLALAHNIVVWCRGWLAAFVPEMHRFGIQRMLRDILAFRGTVVTTKRSRVVRLTIARREPYARLVQRAFSGLFAPHIATLHLGEI